MILLDWPIYSWFMQGLLTSILTGIGFLVISFTIEYVKRFRKFRRAREQEIFLQRILSGEQVLEWSNGTVRAPAKENSFHGNVRSIPRGQQLFEQYKKTGGFLGVGQGYYSRLAEVGRRVAEELQDRSIAAVVSRTSWCGGPGSHAIFATSSTSVDDELTSLEWDSACGDHLHPNLPSYLSQSSYSRGAQNSSSNGNNALRLNGNCSLSSKCRTGGVRLWSTQTKPSVNEVGSERDPKIAADLCARALREHPHLAPFLRQDVLEAAQAVEREGLQAAKLARTLPSRRVLDRSKTSHDGMARSVQNRPREQRSKRSLSRGKTMEVDLNRAVSLENSNKRIQSEESGTKVDVFEKPSSYITPAKRSSKLKLEKLSDQFAKQRNEKLKKEESLSEDSKKEVSRQKSKILKKERSNVAKEGDNNSVIRGNTSLKKERSNIVESAKSNVGKRKTDIVRRESSGSLKTEKSSALKLTRGAIIEGESSSLTSLPSRKKSETRQNAQLLVKNTRSETMTSSAAVQRRLSRKEKSMIDRNFPRSKQGGEIFKSQRASGPNKCEKSATQAIHNVIFESCIKSREVARHEGQGQSTSSSVDYIFSSSQETAETFSHCDQRSPYYPSSPETAYTKLTLDEEGRDVISSSISGYIRKLVFGETAAQSEESNSTPKVKKSSEIITRADQRFKHIPTSPMTTIEESPLGNGATSSEGTTLVSEQLENLDSCLANMYDPTRSETRISSYSVERIGNIESGCPSGASVKAIAMGSSSTTKDDQRLTSKTSQELSFDVFSNDETIKAVEEMPKAIIPFPNTSTSTKLEQKVRKRHPESSPPLLKPSLMRKAASFSKSPPKSSENKRRFHSFKRTMSSQAFGSETRTNVAARLMAKKPLPRQRSWSQGIESGKTDSKDLKDTKSQRCLHRERSIKCNVNSPKFEKPKTKSSKKGIKQKAHGALANSGLGSEDTTIKRRARTKIEHAESMAKSESPRATVVQGAGKGTHRLKTSKSKLEAKRSQPFKKNEPFQNIPNEVDGSRLRPHKKLVSRKTISKPKVSPESVISNRHKSKSRADVTVPAKQNKEREKARKVASKMLDNYNIEIKRKEVLGSVVSLVTYHPKTESSSKEDTSGGDQSDNCKYEKRKKLLHDNRNAHLFGTESCGLNCNDSRLASSLIAAKGPVQQKSDTTTSAASKAQVTSSTSVGSSLDGSRADTSKVSALSDSYRGELDTDSDSELKCSPKYKSRCVKLAGHKKSENCIDTFQDIFDASEELSRQKPFRLQPSALDDVVKSLITKIPNSHASESASAKTNDPKGSYPSVDDYRAATYRDQSPIKLPVDQAKRSVANVKHKDQTSIDKFAIENDVDDPAGSMVKSKGDMTKTKSAAKRSPKCETTENANSIHTVAISHQSKDPQYLDSPNKALARGESKPTIIKSLVKSPPYLNTLPKSPPYINSVGRNSVKSLTKCSTKSSHSSVDSVKRFSTSNSPRSPIILSAKISSVLEGAGLAVSHSQLESPRTCSSRGVTVENQKTVDSTLSSMKTSELSHTERRGDLAMGVKRIERGACFKRRSSKGVRPEQHKSKRKSDENVTDDPNFVANERSVLRGTQNISNQVDHASDATIRRVHELKSKVSEQKSSENKHQIQRTNRTRAKTQKDDRKETISRVLKQDFKPEKEEYAVASQDNMNVSVHRKDLEKSAKNAPQRKFFTNRNGPVDLQELDYRHSKARGKQPTEDSSIKTLGDLCRPQTPNRCKIDGDADSPSLKYQPNVRIFPVADAIIAKDDQPVKKERSSENTAVFTKFDNEKIQRSIFQKLSTTSSKMNTMTLQGEHIDTQVFSTDPEFSNEYVQTGTFDEQTQSGQNHRSMLTSSNTRVFGSNASFSVNTFQAACSSETKPIEPEVKVSNYRFHGDPFRTYRQCHQIDEED